MPIHAACVLLLHVSEVQGVQLASSNSSSCELAWIPAFYLFPGLINSAAGTVFRFNGASILAKAHNNSCSHLGKCCMIGFLSVCRKHPHSLGLTWTDSWSLVPCWGPADVPTQSCSRVPVRVPCSSLEVGSMPLNLCSARCQRKRRETCFKCKWMNVHCTCSLQAKP